MLRALSLPAHYCSYAVALATCLALSSGCSKTRSSQQAPVPASPAPMAKTEERGTGEGKIRDVTVFVDGKAVAVTRYSELPLGLKWYSRENAAGDGVTSQRFLRVSDYLAALGVDTNKIKTVCFHGSWDRVAAIDGDELKKFQDRLVFDFSGEDYGKPRMRWSTVGLRTPTNIDLFQAIYVYVDKTPPTYNAAQDGMVLGGKAVEGLPFVNEALPKGTRFYVDGKLVGAVKRRELATKLIVNPDDLKNAKFSFATYIETLGVDLAKVKAVDFVSGDTLAHRAGGRDFEKKDALVFSISNRMKGKVQAHFPGGMSARVTSVQVFVNAKPPEREVDTDSLDQGGSDDPQSGGHDNQDVNNGDDQSSD